MFSIVFLSDVFLHLLYGISGMPVHQSRILWLKIAWKLKSERCTTSTHMTRWGYNLFMFGLVKILWLKDGLTCLFRACETGDILRVQVYLDNGADPNKGEVKLYPRTSLHSSLIHSHLRWKGHDGIVRWSPLHSAAKNGNVELAMALIKAKANVNIQSNVWVQFI